MQPNLKNIISKNRIMRNTFYAQLAAFVMSSLTHSIGTMIDGVIIGQCLGVDSMAAFGLISPLIVAFSLAGAIVASGARNRFTTMVGGGKVREAQGVFSLSLVLSIGTGVILMLVLLPVATPFTKFLGASGNAAGLLPKARAYLIGILIGLPAMNAVRILNAYMPIDNDRNLPVIASIVLTVTNIVFDLFVVFVIHGDTFEMGLSTSLSYYAAAAVLLLHFRKKDILLRFSFLSIPWKESVGIVAKGLPAGVCRIGNTLRSTYMNHFLAIFASSAAIAAYSVHRQADSMLNPLTIGMADTVAMLAGIVAGEEDRHLMKRMLNFSLQATILLTLSVSVIAFFLAPQFAALFIKDSPEAFLLSTRAVRAYAVGMPLYGLNLIYQNYFQGIGKSRLSSISGFFSEAGFLVLSAWFLSRWFGADAVWYAFPVTQVLMMLYYRIVVFVVNRQPGYTKTAISDKILLLPDSFDVPEEDCLEKSVTRMDEITELSQAVWAFCDAHGCDDRRRLLLSLSVEEMAGNVIIHGFSKDHKHHSIDLRIIKKGEDYTLRIRDDCLIFDPFKQIALYSEDDPTHHIGIHLIYKTAKDIKYTCILKLNNLLVKM